VALGVVVVVVVARLQDCYTVSAAVVQLVVQLCSGVVFLVPVVIHH
jgi:hypothetical protein